MMIVHGTPGSPGAARDTTISRRAALAAAGVGVAAIALTQGGSAKAQGGKLAKEVANLGMPWEEQYGYAQAVKVGNTLDISGQLSHDQGKMVAPAAAVLTGTRVRRSF
jgi:enamine deaminase RidA (YjgF/YER057c/UK114 family)